MGQESKSTFRNKERFIDIVKNSSSISEVLIKLDLTISGGNYNQVHKYCSLYGINTPKVDPKEQVRKALESKSFDFNLVFTEDSKISRKVVKKYFKKIVPYECAICKTDKWRGKPISLQLDHINGVKNDNRKENLRLLCPNCHSQTPTFGGRNKTQQLKVYKCMCGKREVSRQARYCNSCRPNRRTKINWPPHSELIDLVNKYNYSQVALKLGVSDNAVRKRIKKFS